MGYEMFDSILFWVVDALVFGILGIMIYKVFTINKVRENDKVKVQAFTDPLTKAGNRHLFLTIMDKLIAKGNKFAVCFMDLDGFKQINDTMGHDAGDELLIALALTFRQKLPSNAIAYRLGGDEFAIVIENISTTEDITTILDNLKRQLQVPFIIENTAISLEYSLGVAIYPEDANTRQDLITYADDAMYYIKENGKNDYYFHNKALKARLENKKKMGKDLELAYAENQFGVSLQPRININDTSNICFEALLYWNHPVLGRLNSEYFIKQADEMALTIKLDQYVLDSVCKKINEFKARGYKNVHIAVNISNRHASRKDFINKLCEILTENNIEKSDIQIELNDNIEINKIETYKMMFERLKQCGADIIINNIEIKYKSLILFSELHVDQIKLSCKFISENSTLDEGIFEDIIGICKKLKYKVIVGRIETEQEFVDAIRHGADVLQGDFLFQKIEYEGSELYLEKYPNYKSDIENLIKSVE